MQDELAPVQGDEGDEAGREKDGDGLITHWITFGIWRDFFLNARVCGLVSFPLFPPRRPFANEGHFHALTLGRRPFVDTVRLVVIPAGNY